MTWENIKNKINYIIPSYAIIPLLALPTMNALVYSGSKLICDSKAHHSMATALDGKLEFIPFFVVFYVLAYLQWCAGYVIIARESKEVCYKYVLGDLIAKVICLIFFLAYPTTIDRPEITGNGFFNWATGIIYALDTPTNLFPSIHCLESHLILRSALELKKTPRWYAPAMFILTLGVFASTLFIKQHVLVDIPAGIIVAELGLITAKAILKRKNNKSMTDNNKAENCHE